MPAAAWTPWILGEPSPYWVERYASDGSSLQETTRPGALIASADVLQVTLTDTAAQSASFRLRDAGGVDDAAQLAASVSSIDRTELAEQAALAATHTRTDSATLLEDDLIGLSSSDTSALSDAGTLGVTLSTGDAASAADLAVLRAELTAQDEAASLEDSTRSTLGGGGELAVTDLGRSVATTGVGAAMSSAPATTATPVARALEAPGDVSMRSHARSAEAAPSQGTHSAARTLD